MSITLPNGLPARRILEAEGIDVTCANGVGRRATRPLRIALLNLMPEKAMTETQIARLLGAAPYQVELTLVIPDCYEPRTTPARHILAFYERWSRIRDRKFDGLIVTGAPVETLPFDEVAYWRELTEVFDWTQDHVNRTFYICWAAQAALHHFHGVPKRELREKMFGVFRHRVAKRQAPLLRGFDEEFPVPVSRHTEVRLADLPRGKGLEVLADSPEAGLCLVEDRPRGAVYMFNHLEYDTGTLKNEFTRDVEAGRAIGPPRNYFPGDDPARPPINGWRAHGHLLFRNWIDGFERESPVATASEEMMQWLLAERKIRPAIEDLFTDFLVWGDNRPDTLPVILKVLAGLNHAPNAVKVHRHDQATVLIELRLNHVDEPTMRRITKALHCVEEVRRLAYRDAKGLGGVCAGWKPQISTGTRADSSSATDASAYSAIA